MFWSDLDHKKTSVIQLLTHLNKGYIIYILICKSSVNEANLNT